MVHLYYYLDWYLNSYYLNFSIRLDWSLSFFQENNTVISLEISALVPRREPKDPGDL